MRAIPERLRGVFTTRRYTNPRLPYLTLPYLNGDLSVQIPLSVKKTWSVSTDMSQTVKNILSYNVEESLKNS